MRVVQTRNMVRQSIIIIIITYSRYLTFDTEYRKLYDGIAIVTVSLVRNTSTEVINYPRACSLSSVVLNHWFSTLGSLPV